MSSTNINKKPDSPMNTESGYLSGEISTSEILDMEEKTSMNVNEKDVIAVESITQLDSGICSSELLSSDLENNDNNNIVAVTNESKSQLSGCITGTQQKSNSVEQCYTQNNEGNTHLHTAIMFGFTKPIPSLIKIVPNTSYLDIRNRYGQTALHIAADLGFSEIVEQLLRAGADPNIRDYRCNSPLHLAIYNNDVICSRSLITSSSISSSNVNQQKAINMELWNIDGETGFFLAARLGLVDIMRLLVNAGANVNAREGKSGYTALHLAIQQRSFGVIRFLCEECHHIYIDEESYGHITAYQLALMMNSEKQLLDYLLKQGAEQLLEPFDSDDEYDDIESDIDETDHFKITNDFNTLTVN